MCVINNITIATADDITTLSDDVNIYPVDLSRTINTLGNDLNWWEKCSYFRSIFFFNLLSVILGTHPWPLSVYIYTYMGRNLHYTNLQWDELVMGRNLPGRNLFVRTCIWTKPLRYLVTLRHILFRLTCRFRRSIDQAFSDSWKGIFLPTVVYSR